ncbi:MAG: sigma-70 family RNA polymerase sigma factor [Oscillospiraceae bacterium]|nr:sigma-70 family RNA polymerase sigma factor [Oscillospiraceae bacterium]
MDDREIIALFLARDEKAISASSAKFGAYCKTIARNILKNEEEAKECVNAVFLKAWESIPPKEPPVLSSYFGKLTKHHALNLLKSSERQKRGGGASELVFEELEECISDKFSVEGELDRKELINTINKFLLKCSDTNRKVFVLRYWYCADISYIANYFGISENNAMVILSRTRKKLKEYLIKEGFSI